MQYGRRAFTAQFPFARPQAYNRFTLAMSILTLDDRDPSFSYAGPWAKMAAGSDYDGTSTWTNLSVSTVNISFTGQFSAYNHEETLANSVYCLKECKLLCLERSLPLELEMRPPRFTQSITRLRDSPLLRFNRRMPSITSSSSSPTRFPWEITPFLSST